MRSPTLCMSKRSLAGPLSRRDHFAYRGFASVPIILDCLRLTHGIASSLSFLAT